MIYAITNRKLISGGEEVYFKQIEKIAAAKPDGIILREKTWRRKITRSMQNGAGRFAMPGERH